MASARNALRKNMWQNWGCYHFLFEKKTVKRSVQCQLFANLPSGPHPSDKYPVNTSHLSRIVYKCFTGTIIW